MYNYLLKSGYVQKDEKNTRIIDSNEKVAKCLEKIAQEKIFTEMFENDESAGNADEVRRNQLMKHHEVLKEEKAKQEESFEVMRNQVKNECNQLIEKAKQEAEILLENAKRNGREEGLRQGLQSAQKEIEDKTLALEQKEQELLAEYNRLLQEMEASLVPVVADVFERVFHVQFDDKKSMVLHLLQNAVSKIENSREFIVRVPKENYLFVLERKEEIEERVSQAARIEIIEDAMLKKNQCIIETDSGVFDCSLDVQMENLVNDLKTLCL